MKIGSIGSLVKGINVENIKFFSKNNLLDFDTIFIDLHTLHYEIWNEFRFVQSSDESGLKEKERLLRARTADVKNFFSHGGIAIVTVNFDPAQLFREYSDVGHVLKDNIFHLLDVIAVGRSNIEVEELLGDQFSDLGVLTDLNRFFQFSYKYKFTKTSGLKLLHTKKGNDVVGLRLTKDAGFCYLLPEFKRAVNIKETSLRDRIIVGLNLLLPEQVAVASVSEDIPDWVDDYVVFDEKEVLAEHEKLSIELQALKTKIQASELRLAGYRELKRLVFAGDQPLEMAVKGAFETLGYQVVVPAGNKDDLNILEDDFKAVVEVKGLTKSGSTMNAMQLDKWVTNYALENDAELPKGILLVNPFRTLAPDLRTETVFPKDMLDYATPRNHCLMKTEDLLAILIDFKAGLITKGEITELLRNTTGLLYYQRRYQ